jgi:hypothetical protein
MNLIRRLLKYFSHPPDVNEDEGYHDHMVGQKTGPFYCGTAFCGHSTKKAARECWKRAGDRHNELTEKLESLMKLGKSYWEAYALVESGFNELHPEDNPKNWPCNRSSAEMQAEFLNRASQE